MSYANALSNAAGFAGPLYAQVASHLRERISASEWQSSAPMPNEAVLAKDIGVSVGTMRKALELLEQERLIHRRQGRGTFVIEASDQSDIDRFVTLVGDGRKLKGDVVAVTATVGAADTEAANRLAIRVGDPIIVFDLNWRASHGVRVSEQLVVPQNKFPGLNQHPNPVVPYFFPVYRRVYKTIVHSVSERLVCISADQKLADTLSVSIGSPLLKVDRTARTTTGQILEWSVRYIHLGTARYVAKIE